MFFIKTVQIIVSLYYVQLRVESDGPLIDNWSYLKQMPEQDIKTNNKADRLITRPSHEKLQ